MDCPRGEAVVCKMAHQKGVAGTSQPTGFHLKIPRWVPFIRSESKGKCCWTSMHSLGRSECRTTAAILVKVPHRPWYAISATPHCVIFRE